MLRPLNGRTGNSSPKGYAIQWPDLDEPIGVEGLLATRMSGESRQSLERWLADWLDIVNQSQTEAELEALRRCVNRGCPLGSTGWVKRTVRQLGLESTLRPRGRPRAEAVRRPPQIITSHITHIFQIWWLAPFVFGADPERVLAARERLEHVYFEAAPGCSSTATYCTPPTPTRAPIPAGR
jgi:hypothetical protein